MAKILLLETTTTNCSVALCENENIIALYEDAENGYSHAEKLHLFIEKALQDAKLSLQQLDAIAVSKGPGSYTGLRIGVSAAKGLCYSLSIPLIAIETMEILARGAQIETGDFIIPMLDARRMEVYTAVFDAAYKQLENTSAKILTADAYKEYVASGSSVCFIGNANEKCETFIPSSEKINYVAALPSAKNMAVVASEKYKQHLFEDVAYFEPFYLKDFVVTPKKK